MNNNKIKRRQLAKAKRMPLVLLNDAPSSKGQQRAMLKLLGATQLLTTTVTTGVIAVTYAVAPVANIFGWATRFQNSFEEYRLLGVRFYIRPITASTGVTKFWFDEKSTSNPTANEAQERTVVAVLPNTNANVASAKMVSWRARDLLDLEYSAIGAATQPVNFKIYTDTASFGAPVVATTLWLIEPEYHIEFRGIAST